MTISELIKHLEDVRAAQGDLPVYVKDASIEYGELMHDETRNVMLEVAEPDRMMGIDEKRVVVGCW